MGGTDGVYGEYLSSVEVYDPTTGSWAYTNSLNVVRQAPAATVLQDGKVLVTGGYGYLSLASAEVYDPGTQSWTMTGAMINDRVAHSATLLQNGKVLVAGGYSNRSGGGTTGAELFDPATGTWTPTGSLTMPRWQHSATVLQDGKVLVVGGSYLGAEVYDPATGAWTPTASPLVHRNVATAFLLPSGKALLAGGMAGGTIGSTASAELYDPATASWSLTGSMAQNRYMHTSTKLLDGKVLVTSGYGQYDSTYLLVGTAEVYDATMGQWSPAGSVTGRYYHAAALLTTGAVLVSGGYNGQVLGTAEIYTPPAGAGYSFTGFFQPIENLPTLNSTKAGSAIPVKFSLGGDRGLAIFGDGYPKSQAVSCTGDSLNAIEETSTAGGSSLTYDASTAQYNYVWKTDKAWAGTCRQLLINFTNGTVQRASFWFK